MIEGEQGIYLQDIKVQNNGYQPHTYVPICQFNPGKLCYVVLQYFDQLT